MKKYIVLSLLLVVTCVLSGQEKPVKNYVPKPPPVGVGAVETFAQAFTDPNVFIGVFECSPKSSFTTLSSGEILENMPGYLEALNRFSMLYRVKPIKGKFVEPIIFVCTLPPPLFEFDRGRRLPGFIPPFGSKWVLALEKTSKEYRIARFGKDIEKYKFLNDRTMLEVLWYGYGALCLKWPEKDKKFPFPEPPYLVKVPESIVDDFKAIQRVVPYTQKERMDPNEMAAITNTSKALKTDVAKSIFAKVLSGKSGKVQDPNDG